MSTRPGTQQCRRCRRDFTFDHLVPAARVSKANKRGFYCDGCVAVLRRKVNR